MSDVCKLAVPVETPKFEFSLEQSAEDKVDLMIENTDDGLKLFAASLYVKEGKVYLMRHYSAVDHQYGDACGRILVDV